MRGRPGLFLPPLPCYYLSMSSHLRHFVLPFCESPQPASDYAVAVQPGCGMSGMASELVEGLDWVLDRHLAQPEPRKPAVVSMSLLVKSKTAAADLIAQKVEELLEAGVIVVAAAGNYHEGESQPDP
jgi:hypothetical protein